MKEKAIEICKNLEGTISKMGDEKPIESSCSIYVATRIKKSTLISKRQTLIKKHNLTKTDLL
tara:strand:- start:50854 stop:51039 length:186 start_codon:yes stop_codon:yes gene_type:complete